MNRNQNRSQANISAEERPINITDIPLNDQYSCTKCNLTPEIKNIDFITGYLDFYCPEHKEISEKIDDYYKKELDHLYYKFKCNLGGIQYQTPDKLFSYCQKCKQYYCWECTINDINVKEHESYHIKVNELSNKCPSHFKDYNNFCEECKKNICSECDCGHSKFEEIPKAKDEDINKLKEKRKRLVEKKELQENLIKFLDNVIETYEKHPLNYYHSMNIKNLAQIINLNEGENDRNLEALNKLDQLKKKFKDRISEYLKIKLKVDLDGKKINLNGKDLKNEDFKLISYLEFPNAEEIDISHNQISDATPLKNLKSPKLKKINLSYNKLIGVKEIKKLVKIKQKIFPILIEIKLDHNEKILEKEIEEIKSLLKVSYAKESELEYELDRNEKQIRLFGEGFFKKNKNNCKITINDESEKRDILEFYKYKEYKKENAIVKITLFMKNNVTDISGMFVDCKALKNIKSIFDINTNSNIKDISELFRGCTSLRKLPDSISDWDTSNIINMEGIFYECQSLNYLPDISKWNTSNVQNMMSVFNRCKTLRELPNIGLWKTQNVQNMSNMFINCSSLKEIPRGISDWNTNKVQTMKKMFKGMTSLERRPDLSKWQIPTDSRNDMF